MKNVASVRPRRVRGCMLTLPRCVLTLLRCVLTLPRCMLTLLRCVNPTQVCVNPTPVCVNPTQVYVRRPSSLVPQRGTRTGRRREKAAGGSGALHCARAPRTPRGAA
jgi:hypothetical protein